MANEMSELEDLLRGKGVTRRINETDLFIQVGNATEINDGRDPISALVVPTNIKCQSGAGIDLQVNMLGGLEFKKARIAQHEAKNGEVLQVSEAIIFEAQGRLHPNLLVFVHSPEMWDATHEEGWDKQKQQLRQAYFNTFAVAARANVKFLTIPILCVGVNRGLHRIDKIKDHLKQITALGLEFVLEYLENEKTGAFEIVRFVAFREAEEEIVALKQVLSENYRDFY